MCGPMNICTDGDSSLGSLVVLWRALNYNCWMILAFLEITQGLCLIPRQRQHAANTVTSSEWLVEDRECSGFDVSCRTIDILIFRDRDDISDRISSLWLTDPNI